MRENCTSGIAPGAPGNRRSYGGPHAALPGSGGGTRPQSSSRSKQASDSSKPPIRSRTSGGRDSRVMIVPALPLAP